MTGSRFGSTMVERVETRRDRIRLYILLNINRRLLTGVLAAGLFFTLVCLGAFAIPTFRQYMMQDNPTRYMFQAFVTALITGVTLVVTLNQLVLSQELGPLGAQRKRMSGSAAFRGDVEDILGATSPPEPAEFLQALVDNTSEKAEIFQESITTNSDSDLRKRVDEYVEGIIDNADLVSEELEGREFGEYTVLKSALDYNYSWKIHQARRIRDVFGEEIDEGEERALIDLIDVLTFFGPAREHIKTLYFQWQLVDLSRGMLYLSVPSLAITSGIGFYLAPASFPGATLGIDNLVWIISAGATIGSLPFLFLTSFILRFATIAKRTLAIGPFILRSSERSTEIDWNSR